MEMQDLLDHLQATRPELPDEIVMSKLNDNPYELSISDAMVLLATEDSNRLEYYLELVEQLQGILTAEEFASVKAGRLAGNW